MNVWKGLAVLLVAASVDACIININDDDLDRRTDVEVSEPFSQAVDGAGVSSLFVDAINGEIVVTADPTAVDVLVEGERRVRSDSRSDASAFLARVFVDVAREVDQVVVRTRQPSNTDGRQVVVDYDVTIPVALDVRVAHVNGTVDVVGAERDVEVDLVNGTLIADLAPIAGATVDLVVVNGNLTLDLPTSISAMLEADVVNGTITVVGLTLQDATSGTRSVRGRLGAGDGLLDLDVTNGTITVRGR